MTELGGILVTGEVNEARIFPCSHCLFGFGAFLVHFILAPINMLLGQWMAHWEGKREGSSHGGRSTHDGPG